MKKVTFCDSRNAMRYVVFKVLAQCYWDENPCTFDDFVGICYYECHRCLRKCQWSGPSLTLIAEEVWRSFQVF